MSVDLCGDQMRMPQEFLNASQIRTPVQQMSGITVAELVGSELRIEAAGDEIALQPLLDDARKHRVDPTRMPQE